MTRIYAYALFLLALNALSAQDYYRWKDFAEEALEEGDRYGALRYYEEAYQLDSSEQDLQYALAQANMALGRYEESLRLFMKVYRVGQGQFYPEAVGQIAELKMRLGGYQSAIKFWDRAKRRSQNEEEIKKIEAKRKACAYALGHPLINEDIQVELLPEEINAGDSDYTLSSSSDSLYFYSRWQVKSNEKGELIPDTEIQSGIFFSKRTDYGFYPGEELEFLGVPNHVQVSHPCWLAAEQRLYFTARIEGGYSKVYVAETQGGLWRARPIRPTEGDVDYHISHPFAYQKEGQTYLLFTSNKPGGFGGYDIWQAKLVGGIMQEMHNLGQSINSPGNEISAAIIDHNKPKVLFASDYWPGYGGYDIFSVDWPLKEADKKEIKNLGRPINSSFNDMMPRAYQEGFSIASDRKEGDNKTHCCLDIYAVETAKVDSTKERLSEVPKSIDDLERLNELLPLSLYFHNDSPNPGSQSNSTEEEYQDLLIRYINMLPKYRREVAQGLTDSLAKIEQHRVSLFFQESVSGHFEKVDAILPLLLVELEKGERITMAIKGYASPLAQNEYNRKLTQRRIECVKNYLSRWNKGALASYMNEASIQLEIIEIPFGESQSANNVSDQASDRRKSVYSVEVAQERRVDIIRIEEH